MAKDAADKLEKEISEIEKIIKELNVRTNRSQKKKLREYAAIVYEHGMNFAEENLTHKKGNLYGWNLEEEIPQKEIKEAFKKYIPLGVVPPSIYGNDDEEGVSYGDPLLDPKGTNSENILETRDIVSLVDRFLSDSDLLELFEDRKEQKTLREIGTKSWMRGYEFAKKNTPANSTKDKTYFPEPTKDRLNDYVLDGQ